MAAGISVLPLVLLLSILIGIADESGIVWNLGGSFQRWFRASVLLVTIVTSPIFLYVVVRLDIFFTITETFLSQVATYIGMRKKRTSYLLISIVLADICCFIHGIWLLSTFGAFEVGTLACKLVGTNLFLEQTTCRVAVI